MQIDPFRIRDHVADFDSIVSEIVERSVETRKTLPMIEDVAYGDASGETVDIFFPEGDRKDLPVHMFIHGGYWRMFSKRDYSYVANTVTQAGAIAVVVDYALMPGQRMERLVDQVRRAKRWVLNHIEKHGGDPSTLTVSGHSAGAHLASFLFHKGAKSSGATGALLLGGLYDLAPLRQSFLQHEIGLTDEEVSLFTPLSHRHDPSCRVILAVGEKETRPFHSQADAFLTALQEQGSEVSLKILESRNHMDSVRDLGTPGTEAGDLLGGFLRARPWTC